jgi:hypothetical protein
MEDNEWSFCSLWTKKIELLCGRALVNKKLQGDYFFNRAAVEGCTVGAELQVAKNSGQERWTAISIFTPQTSCHILIQCMFLCRAGPKGAEAK